MIATKIKTPSPVQTLILSWCGIRVFNKKGSQLCLWVGLLMQKEHQISLDKTIPESIYLLLLLTRKAHKSSSFQRWISKVIARARVPVSTILSQVDVWKTMLIDEARKFYVKEG
jgi:hypothetical protein